MIHKLKRLSQDNSDTQYRSFRSNIPALLFLAGLHLASSKLFNRIFYAGQPDDSYRVPYHVVFAILTLFGLHGFSALKVLGLVSLNYAIAKYTTGKKLGKGGAVVGWVFNIGVLFVNEWYGGYTFGSLGAPFALLVGRINLFSYSLTELRRNRTAGGVSILAGMSLTI
jgi:hypothetical protein